MGFSASKVTGMISALVGLCMLFIFAGNLLPIGLANLTAFTSTNSTIQTLVNTVFPVVGVMSLVYGLYRAFASD